MDALEQKIKNLSEAPTNFGAGMHATIMRRVFFLRFRRSLLFVCFLLLVNISLAGWRVWVRVGEMETTSIMKITFGDLEISWLYLEDLAQTVIEYVPIGSAVSFLTNLALFAYIGNFFYSFRKHQTLKVEVL